MSLEDLKKETDAFEKCVGVIHNELRSATARFGRFNSPHEGYAVIKEELEELWDDIKKNSPNMMKEAVQVAAMAIRFLMDLEEVWGVELSVEGTKSGRLSAGDKSNDPKEI